MDRNDQQSPQAKVNAPRTTLAADRPAVGWARDAVVEPASPRVARGRRRPGEDDERSTSATGDTQLSQAGGWEPAPEVVERRGGPLQGRSGDLASADWARDGSAADAGQGHGGSATPSAPAPGAAGPSWLSSAGSLGSLLAGGALLAGVAGGGSGGGSSTPAATVAATRTLVVHDGLISGAKVYVDTNGNGKADASEQVGVTDSNGKIELSANLPSGNLLVVGGTNIDTGLPNTMTLALSAGAVGSGNIVVNPLTTLVLAVQGTAAAAGTTLSVAAAQAAVKQALGLSTDLDLSTYDPFAAANAGSATALAVQKAAAQLATVASATVLTSTTDTYGALAGAVLQGGSSKLNLTDAGQLQSIFGTTASQLHELQDLAQANQAIASAGSASQVSAAQSAGVTPSILGLAHDTGSSATDKITADPTLVISGRNDGAVLQLSSNGGATWVAAESFAPADGAVQVIARLSYANGFVSQASAPFSFTLNSATPPQPGLALVADTGSVATDAVTSNGAYTLAGADKAALVEYSVDQVSWSTSAPQAHEGANTIYVRQSYPLTGATSSVGKLSFTLDTVANAGTAGLAANTLDDTWDTGVTGDNITSVVRPQLSGSAEAGAVEVRVTVAGKTTVLSGDQLAANGSWSLALDKDLPQGSHAISVEVIDRAGNHSAPTVVGTVTIDTTAPDVGTGHLAAASDSGLSPDDGITNVTRPVISGTAEPFAIVQVDIDSTIYQTTAGSDGSWSVQVTDALTDGEYTPSITLIDRAGNASEPFDGQTFTVVLPPEEAERAGLAKDEEFDTGFDSEDGITQVQTPLLTGALDREGVVVVVKFAGATYVTLTQDDGTWSVQIPEDIVLDDGTYVPQVTYMDDAGNVLRVGGTPVVIDTTAPDEATAEMVHDALNDTGADATDGITSNTSPLFKGTSEPFAFISLDIDGNTFETQADADGNWQIRAEGLSDGEFTPLITVTDAAGNVSDAIEGTPFVIDTEGPDAAEGALVHDDVSDTGIDATDSITANNMPSFAGTAEADAVVTLTIGTLVFTTTADSDGNWTIDADKAIPDGTWTPIVSVQDIAGNVTEAELEPLTIDTTPPSAGSVTAGLTANEDNDTGSSATDGLTNVNAPELSGTADPLAQIHIDIDGNVYDVQADEDGNWAITLDELDDGTYTPVITVVDAAGNESQPIEGKPFTIDTTVPDEATAELVHDALNDTGADVEDGITANTSPLFKGTSEPFAFISLDIDGNTFETQADADGNWQIRAEGLSDGEFTPLITVTDAAGNVSDAIEGTPFVIDTEGPDAAEGALVHDDVSDTGIDATDSITANNMPSFAGTAEADAVVTLTIGKLVFTTTADSDGNWTIDADKAIPDGTWTPVVAVQDIAGNVTEAELEPLTIDTTPPSAGSVTAGLSANEDNDTGSSATDGLTNVNAPELSGTADPLAQIHIDIDGNVYDVQADEDGNWAITIDELDDGTYTPVITVVDAAGNESAPIEGKPFTIDTTVPDEATAELVHDAVNDTGADVEDGITANTSPLFKGTSEPFAFISLDIDGNTFETQADADGNWQIRAEGLSDGEFTPLITVTDAAGNVSDAIEGTPFVIDTEGPDAAEGALVHDDVSDTGIDATDSITANNMPSFAGTAEADAVVTLTIGTLVFTTTADSDGNWTIDADKAIPDGTWTPIVSVQDIAGNVTEAELEPLTIDTTPPSAGSVTAGLSANEDNDTGSSATDGLTNVNAPELSGTADPLAQIHIDIDGNVYDVQADEDGNWAITIDELDDGTYTPVITVVDAAGNESAPIEGKPFTIDTEVPDAADGGLRPDAANDTGLAQDDNITRNNRPVLEGTAEPGSSVLVEVGDAQLTTTADAKGHWSVQLTEALDDGEYTPVVTVTDAAGNASDPVELPLLVIDTTVDTPTGGLTHDETSDTGADAEDGITSNRQPSLSGTAEALARVQVTVGGHTLTTFADEDGVWSLDLDTELADGTYTPQILVTDVAGNTASHDGEAFTVITRIALPGGDLGQHQVVVAGTDVKLNVIPAGMSSDTTVEDYGGNLADGLEIQDGTQAIVGSPNAPSVTWLAVNATDLAGNEAVQYLQLASVTAIKSLGLAANTINSVDAEKPSLYVGTDAAQTFNIYASNGDVLQAGGGDDLVRLYYNPASYGFARIDGGAGTDQIFFAGTGIEVDFSDYNNPDGNGQVIERVESFFFSGTDAAIHITANDLLHMRSDLLDVDGKHQVVRFLSNSGNKGTVDVEGLTQVGASGAWGATGAVSSGASNDKFTKLVGVVNDGTTDHLVELLVQNGLTVHTA